MPPILFGVSSSSSRVSGADTARVVEANHAQLVDDFAPAWGFAAPAVVLAVGAASEIECKLRDAADGDPVDALAYHTVEGGAPTVHVLVDRILDQPGATLDDVSCALGHELMELLGDPFCDDWSDRGDGTEEPRELVDRVQGGRYRKTLTLSTGAQVELAVSNFLLPAAFNDEAPEGTKYDWCGTLRNPRDVAPGGYHVVRRSGGGAATVFGDRRAALAHSSARLRDRGVDVELLRAATMRGLL